MINYADYQKRLNEMMISDTKESIGNIDNLIKSEIVNVLRNYFYISNDDVELKLCIEGNGKYLLSLSASTQGIKKLKKIT